ncbi:MAG TPA: nucleotidyltransferase family protein [Rhodospirillales bacterium]|nr:nucleotidyltransferase family protein [Rhodospirillales bacterium]
MTWSPQCAMVLAAGFGKRLRPITEKTPKPLVNVHGRSLIDRTIDRLVDAGIGKVVVNIHHLGEQISQHLGRRESPEIVFSPEAEILNTGGGIANALPLLGDQPFFACNADTLWLNGTQDALKRMIKLWDPDKMDALLMLHSTVEAYGYAGMGDFCSDPDGLLTRRPENEVSPLLFTGVQILHPRLFENVEDEAFSMNLLYDRAIENERLYGMVHDGEWFHVGTPEGLADAESYMKMRYAGVSRR